MARVVYVGKSDAVQLADGTECRRGDVVEVDDDLAAGLLEQSSWRAAPKPKPNKPAEPEKESAK